MNNYNDDDDDDGEFAAHRRFIEIAARQRDQPKLGPKPALLFHREFDTASCKKFIVDDFLAEGEVSCFFGEPGATKGTLAVDIACHVAAGLPWMGRGAGYFADDRDEWWPSGVLYIALERAAQVQRRVDAFAFEHELKEPLDLAIWGGPLDLVNSENDDIIGAMKQHTLIQENTDGADGSYREVKLVVIDTLARAFGSGSDSGGEETAAVARKLERVLRYMPETHILIIHHTPIGDDSRLRGHGNLLAAFDQTVRVRKHKAGSTATVMKDNDTAEEGKAKFAYALKSRVIHVDEKTGRETLAPVVEPLPLDAIKETPPKASKWPKKADRIPKPSGAEQSLFDSLAGLDGPVNEDGWRAAYDDIREEGTTPGNHRTRFSRGKTSLEKKGLITKDENGKWSVTDLALQSEKL